MQIDEHAPTVIRDALDRGELSINQRYNLTRQLQGMSEEQREELAAYAVEMIAAKQEISRTDAEAEHRGKIAGLFCKAFERAVLLTPTEENVRLWVEGTRMRSDEIEDSIKEAYRWEQRPAAGGAGAIAAPGGDGASIAQMYICAACRGNSLSPTPPAGGNLSATLPKGLTTCQLSLHTPKFRYAAKVTQRK